MNKRQDERAAERPGASDRGAGGGGTVQPRAKAPKSKPKGGSGWDTIKTVIYAVLIALVVRTVLIEPFSIPSRSMLPTLLVSDYLFVSKFSYGYSKHSLPFSLALFKGRIFAGEPKRGDVAVFKLPSDNRTDYIKRIIGLPGDRIQVKGGRLYINGKMVKREPAGTYRDVQWRSPYGAIRLTPIIMTFNRYKETLPNGKSHLILELSDQETSDNTGVFVVPKGKYFMMGDNRDNSQDSRFPTVGFVPSVNLVGRADFIFFSLNEQKKWWQIWNWPGHIRWSRIFKAVE